MKVGDLIELDWIHFSMSPEKEHPPVYGVVTKIISEYNLKYETLEVRWLNHPRIASNVQDLVESHHVKLLSTSPWKVTLSEDEIKEIESDVKEKINNWEERLCNQTRKK